MSSTTTWILVCDASRARLFAVDGHGPWTLVDTILHPASQLKGADLAADRPGRSHQRTSEGRSAMEPHTDPREVEAEHFAGELAARLYEGHGKNAYRDVVLVAPPRFLGLLRGAIDEQVAKQVRGSVDKDLTKIAARDLPEHLKDVLR
jgi:protein required for attachment to host cells